MHQLVAVPSGSRISSAYFSLGQRLEKKASPGCYCCDLVNSAILLFQCHTVLLSKRTEYWIAFHTDLVSWQPHSHPLTCGVGGSVGSVTDRYPMRQHSCSVQQFRRPLQTRFPALGIAANRTCPLGLAPGSDQPCVNLVRFLEIIGEENTPVRWCGLLPMQYFSGTRAQLSNGWKQGQNTGKNRIFIPTDSDPLHILNADTACNGQLEVRLHFSQSKPEFIQTQLFLWVGSICICFEK